MDISQTAEANAQRHRQKIVPTLIQNCECPDSGSTRAPHILRISRRRVNAAPTGLSIAAHAVQFPGSRHAGYPFVVAKDEDA